MKKILRQVRGFTLISALFVLVVVSSLGVYLVNLSSGQHLSTALSVRSAQALFAAHSGMDWVIYRLSQGDNCAALPASLNIDAYTVDIDSCSVSTLNEGGASYSVFAITVTSQIGTYGDSGFVSRQIDAVIMGT